MAHGRQGPDIVANIRYVGMSAIRAVSDHERYRTPDGASAIDPTRSHLNEVLHGPATQQEALEALWATGVKKPAAQAETPYVQMVLSASPGYFRAPGQGRGQWDQEKLKAWLDATMAWLRREYGADLIHASLHLDEDTPHIHALIVPTYRKAKRMPGRMKRGETPAEFEARKAAALASTIRAAGRSSCEQWARPMARRLARKSYHEAVEDLGLGYGRDFIEEAQPSPSSVPTGVWVRQKAADLATKEVEMESARIAAELKAAAEAAAVVQKAEAEAERVRAAAAADARASAAAFESLAREIEAGTIRRGDDGRVTVRDAAALLPGRPHIDAAIRATVTAQDAAKELGRAALMARADAEQAKEEAQAARAEAIGLRNTLQKMLNRVRHWLKRDDLTPAARDTALRLVRDGHHVLPPEEPPEESGPGGP